jgi:hypothetical protein
MSVEDRVMEMIRDREVKCPICGAGWRLVRMDARSLRVVEDAARQQVEEHRRIAAASRLSRLVPPLRSNTAVPVQSPGSIGLSEFCRTWLP